MLNVCVFIDFFLATNVMIVYGDESYEKFIINHYRETYSSSHYPILLQDFGWLFCNFSRILDGYFVTSPGFCERHPLFSQP